MTDDMRELADALRECIAHAGAVEAGQGCMLVIATAREALARVERGPGVEWRCFGDGLHAARFTGGELRVVQRAGRLLWSVDVGMDGQADTLDEAKADAERAAGVRRG